MPRNQGLRNNQTNTTSNTLTDKQLEHTGADVDVAGAVTYCPEGQPGGDELDTHVYDVVKTKLLAQLKQGWGLVDEHDRQLLPAPKP